MDKKIRKWIILPDHQIPHEDKKSLAAVEKYMAAYRWDGYINLGDFLDFNELSSYVEGKPGAVEEDVASTFAAGNAILDRHCAIIRSKNKNARMILVQGNHDYRAVSYALKYPALKQLLDVQTNLRLKDRDIQWVRSWERGELFNLGYASFTHGLYTTKYHAARMADAFGCDIIYGHNHDLSSFSKISKGHNNVYQAWSMGCLCKYDQTYMKGAPQNWQQAFGVFYLQPGGLFTIFTVPIFYNRFVSPEGDIYAG